MGKFFQFGTADFDNGKFGNNEKGVSEYQEKNQHQVENIHVYGTHNIFRYYLKLL